MTIKQVADRLVELSRKGEWYQAQKELYHEDIISIEPAVTEVADCHGMKDILEKNKKWEAMTEKSHGVTISDPIIADSYFCISIDNDVTLKEIGRVRSSELAVYQVKEGRIISEQFFHS